MHQNMEDSSVGGVLGSALMLIEHYEKQISGARKDVDDLKGDITSMIKYLVDHIKDKDDKDEKFKEWVGGIRKVVFDVEDFIMTSCASMEKSRCSCLAPVNKLFKPKQKNVSLGEQIKDLREKTVIPAFETARQDFAALPTVNRSSQASTTPPTVQKQNTMQENLSTFRNQMRDFIAACLESRGRQVFAIVGKPGSGKTTLARNIHDHVAAGDTFHRVIWVDVPKEFNKQNVILTIHNSFDAEDREKYSNPEESVRENLRVGDFLILFHNVGTKDVFNEIRGLLPLESNRQGKVVITTEDEDVAKYAAETEETYILESFDDELKRREVLHLAVFGRRSWPWELVTIGKEIAHYIGGVLLDILVIGGVLHDSFIKAAGEIRKVEEEWNSICERLKSNVQLIPDRNLACISLSYDTLSYELKNCFLYLGIFSEDMKIPLWKLARLWIAEGLLHHQEERSLEDIAQDYVQELAGKKLIIVENKTGLDGRFKTVHVHDLIRNFCLTKAKDLFQEIKVSSQGDLEPGFNEIRACRRICLHSSSSLKNFLQEKLRILSEESVDEKLRILKAHSVLAFCKEKCALGNEEVPSMSEGLNLLRVLDIKEAINFQKFPEELTKLVLLKYVTLSGDEFHVLPKQIYKLWNVQTLEVHTSSPTIKIKASSIWKMKQLRHFKTKASIILTKNKDGRGGKNVLSTLEWLSPQSCTVEVLSKANNLRSLGIRGDLVKLSCSLENLHLDNLKLVNVLSDADAEKRSLWEVAKTSWFPKNIKSLVLSGTKLESEHMAALGGIGTLEVLKLKNSEFGDDHWDVGDGSFTSLKSLHVSSKNLKEWNALGTAFCEIEKIVLRNCGGLTKIPEELVLELRKLKLLHMDGVSRAAIVIGDRIKERSTFNVIADLLQSDHAIQIGSKGMW